MRAEIGVASVPVGGGVIVGGVVVTQPVAGTFAAFDATCPHAGCAVRAVAAGTINCFCHGSRFRIADGRVAGGPAPAPLTSLPVEVDGVTIRVGDRAAPPVDDATAYALAEGYAAFMVSGDRAVLETFSPEFRDNVSGRGIEIFTVVAGWLADTFADRTAETHLVTHTDDTVMVWYTMHGRHVGNGFPRLHGLAVSGNAVAWPQVHVFRFAGGLVVEHWAVRDDAALLDAVTAQPAG